MSKENGEIRSVSRRGAASVEPQPAPVIPTVSLLVEGLRKPSALVRQMSALQLGRLGASALDALPGLQTAVSDKNRQVRRAARRALKQIQQQEAQHKTSFWKRFLKRLREAFSEPHA